VRTLFLRIFISFWLAMATILTGAVAVTGMVVWYRMTVLSSINPAELMTEASVTLRAQGISGLKAWLETVVRAHPDFDVYVVDALKTDLLGRDLPERIEQWLVLDGTAESGRDDTSTAGYWPLGYDWSPHGVTLSHNPTFNRSHLLANPKLSGPDGRRYTLLVAWFGATPTDVIGSYGVALALVAVALLMSAAICWGLARYISAPLAELQKSARTLAGGNFEAQVDEKFCRRRDELGILARDFNQMAARLHAQIASKEVLLRDISHELRSPLTRLRVALGLAQLGDEIDVQHRHMERDIERLDMLIGETLQLSRLSGAVPAFVNERVELGVLVNEISRDARLEGSALGKSVSSCGVEDLCVYGNAELIRRAVENVMRNAVRFEPVGGTVNVSVRTDGAGATIAVRDHGRGVPQADLERIFEAFYRVDEARERDSGGTGLGLAIAARVTALHGGAAKAYNASGGGLIVELHFPQTLASSGSIPADDVTAGYPASDARAVVLTVRVRV
jgi:two-component system, OmpR family, sensor kinase